MLLWFADLMNVTEEVTIHRSNVSTFLSSAFNYKFIKLELGVSYNSLSSVMISYSQGYTVKKFYSLLVLWITGSGESTNTGVT